jgi:hypothetical protein
MIAEAAAAPSTAFGGPPPRFAGEEPGIQNAFGDWLATCCRRRAGRLDTLP